jgi:hypothetical protein
LIMKDNLAFMAAADEGKRARTKAEALKKL